MHSKAKSFFTPLINNKKILLVALILALISFLYLMLKKSVTPVKHSAKIVEVEVAKKDNIKQFTTVFGNIKAAQQTILTSKAKGILHIFLPAGQFVNKGALIAKIENNDLERNYHTLKQMEEIAQRQLNRVIGLLSTGAASKKMIEEKTSAFLEVQKQLSDTKIILE